MYCPQGTDYGKEALKLVLCAIFITSIIPYSFHHGTLKILANFMTMQGKNFSPGFYLYQFSLIL